MKTPFKVSELICLSIIFAGLIMNLFDLTFAYLVSTVGTISFGVVGLIDAIKNKYYLLASGKIVLPLLSVLLIAIGISGIMNKTPYQTFHFIALFLYSMQLRKVRTPQLTQSWTKTSH